MLLILWLPEGLVYKDRDKVDKAVQERASSRGRALSKGISGGLNRYVANKPFVRVLSIPHLPFRNSQIDCFRCGQKGSVSNRNAVLMIADNFDMYFIPPVIMRISMSFHIIRSSSLRAPSFG